MIIDSTITQLSHVMSNKNTIITLADLTDTVNCWLVPDTDYLTNWTQECLIVENGNSYTYTLVENIEPEHWYIDYNATE
jgi:hypothetical protein